MGAVVFCNIAWMKNYRGITDEDQPYNGGSFVKVNISRRAPHQSTIEPHPSTHQPHLGNPRISATSPWFSPGLSFVK